MHSELVLSSLTDGSDNLCSRYYGGCKPHRTIPSTHVFWPRRRHYADDPDQKCQPIVGDCTNEEGQRLPVTSSWCTGLVK